MEHNVSTGDLINDFAVRSFRDEGDADYIAGRMAFRAALSMPSLWASQQAVEKYLKCILLLNRIPGAKVKHELSAALDLISRSTIVSFDLSPATLNFIERIDAFGKFRYLEVSRVAYGGDIVNLDRAAWELRRYCTLYEEPRLVKLCEGVAPPKYRIPGGYLEQVMDDAANPAREPLCWNNAFFGTRQRRRVRVKRWLRAENAPLYLNPQILDEILKYVYLPKDLKHAYRTHIRPG